ncbi:amino acid adenylation domain-containing protein [Amycolatopsis sp. NPDC051758]|uniref:amino acid adenylation domain-containing protein n=1 Tax=Amycolatopsis sp. NPDC051758 TaxID=3363935 RepID=UPI00378D8EDA
MTTDSVDTQPTGTRPVRRPRRAAIPRADRAGRLPVSFDQQRLFALNQLEPDSPAYLVPFVLRLRGELDVEALSRAWTALLRRHEPLRTRFRLAGGEPVQVIDAEPVAELLRTSAADLAAATAQARADLAAPFDLGRQHPVRARLIRIGDGDHVLAVALHHIACDDTSLAVLTADLAALYRAELRGTGAGLPELPVQYADYAAWQRDRLSGPALDRTVVHWQRRLSGLTPLDLPTDRPRPSIRGWAGDRMPFHVPAPLAGELRSLAQDSDATMYTLLLTAFQVLLGRLTGQTDLAVGSAVNRRNRGDLGGVVGFFLNTLVMRTPWSGDPDFATAVRENRGALLDALEHQDVPIDRLVGAVDTQRDLSRTPLFQVMFDWASGNGAPPDLPGLTAEHVSLAGAVAKFDLTMQVGEAPEGGLAGVIEYATELFDGDSVRRLARNYLRLLESAVAAPHTRLSELDILAPEERTLLLSDWNRTALDRPWTSVPDAVAARAAADPAAPALLTDDGSTSCGDLDRRAGQLAHRLRELGVGAETPVGVCLERSPDLVVALLAVWRAGGAYVPVDPTHPAERVGYQLTDSAVTVVLTSVAARDRVPELPSATVLVLEDERADLASRPVAAPVRVDPDSLAYVIYTSGTTGRPKGVLVTHRGLVNYLQWCIEQYAGDSPHGTALFTSVAFDLTVPNLYVSLMTGRPVRLLPADLAPDELAGRLVAGGPYAFVKLTPAHLDLLATHLTPQQARDLTAVVIPAGDAFSAGLLATWQRLSGSRIVNEYGPTEITVGNSVHVVEGPPSTELVPIGTPIPNTTAYVLDTLLQPAPIGAIGEVYVGGVGVARGYHGKPDLTAEKFVPDPYGTVPGGRLYRTGDLARVLPRGDFDFVGRVDNQVKIRGYRIEPAEIEAVLTTHPGVRDAVVLAEDGRLGAHLVFEAQAPELAELRGFLAARVPGYMVPSTFTAVDAFPLTENGKVDRRALSELDGSRLAQDQERVPPRTDLEARIAEIWRDCLRVPELGVLDNFFDVGGDSIRAVALVGALREAGLDLTVRDVFAERTVAGLAEFLAGAAPAVPVPGVAPFALLDPADAARLPEGVVDAYPLSQVQAGMAVAMLSDPDAPYHNGTSYEVRSERPFQLEALNTAANLVVARHEVLRTAIDLTSYSVPMQLVHGEAVMTIGSQDLRHLTPAEREAEIHTYMAAERRNLFDFATPPLIRIFAHVTADDAWWISITECHPVIEGWTYHLMLMEIVTAYHDLVDGRTPQFAELPAVRFADFIAAELEALKDTDDREYWQRVVTDSPPLTLPAGWSGGAKEEQPTYTVEIPYGDLRPALLNLASRARVPLKSVLHAVHLTVMGMLTLEPSFSTGLVCDTRPEVLGADRVFGMYLNTLPFAFRRGARTWLELVQQVFAGEVELWPHRRYPVPAIQREVGEGAPLHHILFNYLDFNTVDLDVVDIYAGIDYSPNDFDLVVVANRTGMVRLSAKQTVVSRQFGELLGSLYRRVLEEIAADPDGDPEACHLPPGELATVVRRHNQTDVDWPEVLTHQLFEDRVRETPDAVAVIDAEGGVTSYAELNEQANRIAWHLRGLGVAPEQFVGVCVDHSVAMLAALLGILKSGAAYVPLDASHPADRLAFMLADTGARVVVSTESLRDRLPAGDHRLVCLDSDAGALAAARTDDPPHVTTPDNLVYAMYTSGSTGRPKGVLISHRGLNNYLLWAVDGYGLDGVHGAPMLGSIAFDLSVPNFFLPLTGGRDVTLVRPDPSLGGLRELLTRPGDHSLLKITPAHLDVLRATLPADTLVNSVRTFVVGADEVKPETVVAWRRIAPGARIIDEYGPTETVVGCSIYTVPDDYDPARPVPIGKPIANIRMYVLDSELRPMPTGVAGELYIGGVGVARGYLNRPDLTAEKFLPDPFSPRPGDRFYRTGDLARLLPDGNLEFLGRTDNQVKIRGYRVEFGEIEARLLLHPGVRDVCVAARPGRRGEKRLVGYVVPDGSAPADGELRRFLADTLPEYMIPAVFVTMDALPLSNGGKVDRARLPAPASGRAGRHDSHAEARTATERALARVWADVLGLDRIGVHDDFFRLGGDSILAIQIVARARQAGLPLTPRLAVRHRTVAEMAAAVDAAKPLPAKVPDPQVSTGQVPLTPIQRWWAETPGHRDLDHYNQTDLLTVEGEPELRIAVLERALLAVVNHHSALRLRLTHEDGQWRQEVAPHENSLLVKEIDATGPEALDAARELHTSLSLADGPLARALLLRGLPDGDRVLLAVHHWAVDTVSWPIVRADLRTAYRQLVAGDPVVLPAVTTSFAEWAHRLSEFGASAAGEAEARYWSDLPPGAPLPVDHRPNEADTVADTRMVTVTLDPAATEALLRRVPAASGYRINEVLVAALGLTITRWTGDDRVLVDLEGHGRGPLLDADLSRTVGWFTAVYPVSLGLPASRHGRDVLATVAETLRAVPNGGIGYGLRPRPELQPEVIFNYHGQLSGSPDETAARTTSELADLTLTRSGRCARSHPLELSVAVQGGRLRVSWMYSARRHEEPTVRRLAEDHLADLRTLIAECTTVPRGDEVARGGGRKDVTASLAEHGVPGVSVAVFADGEIVDVWQEGVRAAGDDAPVTAGTAFQCGSVSKHVSTLVALRLVADGRLDLDRDISAYLESWRLLDTEGVPAKVTLRQLLTHTGGLTPAWYAGYHPKETWPSLVDVLDGVPPAATPEVRVHPEAAGGFRYSGSHFSVVQLLLCDITGEDYAELARRLVFAPLGLEQTSFDPAYPVGAEVAHAHGREARQVDGGWRAVPEAAAAGLWTTSADLARIALAVRQAAFGQPGALLPAELARQLLTDQAGVGYGLGTVLDEAGPVYGHVGDTVGFRALSVTDLSSAGGLVVLTNGDGGTPVIDEVIKAVVSEHPALRWASGAGFWMRAVIGGSLGAAR